MGKQDKGKWGEKAWLFIVGRLKEEQRSVGDSASITVKDVEWEGGPSRNSGRVSYREKKSCRRREELPVEGRR